MKIPKKLKIGGHIYKIEFHKEGGICSDKADLGVTLREKGVIELNKNIIQSEQEGVLFHEIFHILNSTIAHDLMDSLSQQFYQVLKDNKLLK